MIRILKRSDKVYVHLKIK